MILRKAKTEDIDAIKRLIDAHRHELGFVLRASLAEGVTKGWVSIVTHEERIVGVVHYRHCRAPRSTIYEICVDQAYRRQGIGKSLVGTVCAEARTLGKERVSLKAPTDLRANAFYAHIGFEKKDIVTGRKRTLNVWEMRL